MTWVKTKTISVPAHQDQTSEVNINEWFQANRSFLLGTPVANQLRGTAGGWAQTLAIAPMSEQDTIALLSDRLSRILNGNINEVNHMATVIPADRFESNSPYAFILRENPKAQGIEIHFPPDSTPAADFIARIASSGFEKAKTNPHLWYAKYSEALISKARGWVKTCQRYGAYELSSDVPVEQTKSRRRGGKSNGSKPPEPAPTASAPNKLVDAIADRMQVMLDQMKAELTPNTSELDALRQQLAEQKAENQRLTQLFVDADAARNKCAQELLDLQQEFKFLSKQSEERMLESDRMKQTIDQQREAIDVAISEVERLGEVVEERDRTITELKQQLSDWGVEVEDLAPTFDDEPTEPPTFDDEPPTFDDDPAPAPKAPNFDEDVEELGESPSDSGSPSTPLDDDTEGSEGFDLDSLGELQG